MPTIRPPPPRATRRSGVAEMMSTQSIFAPSIGRGPVREGLARHRDRFILWGYGHYGIFAALAALGAGLKVAVEQDAHHVSVSPVAIGYAVAIPVGVFLVLMWAVHAPIVTRLAIRPAVMLGGAIVILLLPLTAAVTGLAFVVASIAAVCALIIVATIALRGEQKEALR